MVLDKFLLTDCRGGPCITHNIVRNLGGFLPFHRTALLISNRVLLVDLAIYQFQTLKVGKVSRVSPFLYGCAEGGEKSLMRKKVMSIGDGRLSGRTCE